MLTIEPTEEMIAEWKQIYDENISSMKPNRKSGTEVDAYLCRQYDCDVLNDKAFEKVVAENIALNESYKEKLKSNKQPIIKTYSVGNVYIGIDIETGYFHIESADTALMEQIHDDLVLFRGLDEKDMQNFFLVAEYVQLSNIGG